VRIMIVGGGKVGSYLARTLSERGYTITVIERDPERAEKLSDANHALVIEGDGTDVRVLQHAGVDRSAWLLGVTGRDEDNLVACELAKTFGVTGVLARLNDPKNRATFEALKIPVVAVTDLMVQVISSEVQVEMTELERIALLSKGKLSLIELDIPDGMPPRLVAEVRLPPQTVLVSVIRDELVEIPDPRLELRPGDRVLAVTAVDREAEVRRALCNVPGSSPSASKGSG